MKLRNFLFDIKFFRIYKAEVPVISVGNITTGGTGKTPLTVFIADFYLRQNKKVAVISRGYNRRFKNIVMVYDGMNYNPDVSVTGDELALIYNNLIKEHKGNFYICASSDRREASKMLTERYKPDIIILDDGFQHRKIFRDLDIVLIDSVDFVKRKFDNKITIPSGNLRESIDGIKRADMLIQNNKSENLNLIDELIGKNRQYAVMSYKTEYIMDSKNCILQNTGLNAIAFSGIANDDSFINMISGKGLRIKERIRFPDHYNYKTEDIKFLSGKYEKGIVFITTEKDFIKIKLYPEFTENYPVYFMKLGIDFGDGKEVLFKKLNTLIR